LRRERNEDYVDAATEIDVVMIADGMGGGDQGDRASRTACGDARRIWREAGNVHSGLSLVDFVMRRVNTNLFEHGQREGLELGTTLTLVAFGADHELFLGHVGDTRVYRIREGKVTLLTEDQRAGGSVLRANIGGSDAVEPALLHEHWQPGDVLVLATDGLWSLLSDDQLIGFYHDSPPEQLGPSLLRDRDNVAQDNYSVLVCWDDAATQTWWSVRVKDGRRVFRECPSTANFDALLVAISKAGGQADPVQELAEAAHAGGGDEIVHLARARLREEQWRRLTEDPRLQHCPEVVNARAEAVLRLGGSSEQEIALVQKAYQQAPSVEMAFYLFKALPPGAPDRSRYAQAVLSHGPGPFFSTWTSLLQDAVTQPKGPQTFMEIVRGTPRPEEIPGPGILGQHTAYHPLERLLIEQIERPMKNEVKKLEQRLTLVEGRFTELASRIADLQSKVAETETTAVNAREEALQTANALSEVERQQKRRLMDLDEAVSRSQAGLDLVTKRADSLWSQGRERDGLSRRCGDLGRDVKDLQTSFDHHMASAHSAERTVHKVNDGMKRSRRTWPHTGWLERKPRFLLILRVLVLFLVVFVIGYLIQSYLSTRSTVNSSSRGPATTAGQKDRADSNKDMTTSQPSPPAEPLPGRTQSGK
jgi:protein phosphatase